MYGKDFEDELARLEALYPEDRKRAALLEALHACQRRAGYVTDEAMHWLAARYGTTPADVQGVVSFYTMYFTEHPGRHVIWMCRTFSCQLLGAGSVMKAFEDELGCHVGQTDATGDFRLRWMECLASCDKAPCALVDDDMYETLTPESVGLVLQHVRQGGGGGRVVVESGKPRLTPLDVHAAGPAHGPQGPAHGATGAR
jgi:NADH-quinone oxidoreductase subunit E